MLLYRVRFKTMCRIMCRILLLSSLIEVSLSYEADMETFTRIKTLSRISEQEPETEPNTKPEPESSSQYNIMNQSNSLSEPMTTSGNIKSISSLLPSTLLLISKLFPKEHKTSELAISKQIDTPTMSVLFHSSTRVLTMEPSESADSVENQQLSVTEAVSFITEPSATIELYTTAEISGKVFSGITALEHSKSVVSIENQQQSVIEVLSSNSEVSATIELHPTSEISAKLEATELLSTKNEQSSHSDQSTTTESSSTTSLYAPTEAYISTEPHEILGLNVTGFLRGIIDNFGSYDDYYVFEEYDGFGDYGGDGGGDGVYDNKRPHVGYGYDEDIIYEDYGYGGYNNHHHDSNEYDENVHVGYDDYGDYVEEYAGPSDFDLFWWLH